MHNLNGSELEITKHSPILAQIGDWALDRKTWLIWGVVLVTIATVSWGGWLSRPVVAQDQRESRIITVSGQGTVDVTTAIASIRLGVLINGTSAQEVQEKVANQSNQLVARLRELQVENLKTTGISLNPQYDYQSGQAKQVGVRGQNSVAFKVPIEQAGQVLDQAIAAGASVVESVQFEATPEAIQQGREAALQLAVQDAQTQAQVVLSALNFSVQSIERIQVNTNNSFPPPVPLAQVASVRAAERAPTPVIGGDQAVTASVTLEIAY